MNNNYNPNIFPGTPIYSGNTPLPNQSISNQYFDMPMEQSYIENIPRGPSRSRNRSCPSARGSG